MSGTASENWLLKGFAEPVHDAHVTFRAVLHALSSPGEIVAVPHPKEHPTGISATATSVLLALADYSTPLWLDPAFSTEAIRKYLGFHTGAPISKDRDVAAFAVLPGNAEQVSLSGFSIGTPEYPDRSTTLIIETATFDADASVRLSGPGIETEILAGASPCPADLWAFIHEANATFPLGIDVIFTTPSHAMALPRSTKIEVL